MKNIRKRQNEQSSLDMLYASRFLFNRAEIRSNIAWICVIISAILGFVSSDDILPVIIVILLLDVVGYLCNAGMVKDVENAADIRKVFERYVYNLPLDEGTLCSNKSSLYEKIDNIIRRHKEEHSVQTQNSGYDTPPGVKNWFDIKGSSTTPIYSCQRYNICFDKPMMRFQRGLYAVIIVMAIIVIVFSLRNRGIINIFSIILGFSAVIWRCVERIQVVFRYEKSTNDIIVLENAYVSNPHQERIIALQEAIENRRYVPFVHINFYHSKAVKKLTKKLRRFK